MLYYTTNTHYIHVHTPIHVHEHSAHACMDVYLCIHVQCIYKQQNSWSTCSWITVTCTCTVCVNKKSPYSTVITLYMYIAYNVYILCIHGIYYVYMYIYISSKMLEAHVQHVHG